jgi:hypothetical protein
METGEPLPKRAVKPEVPHACCYTGSRGKAHLNFPSERFQIAPV